MKNFQKLKIALEYQLIGKGYLKALKAFNIARSYHSWTRKDGVTPEFQHQIEIALYLMTLKDVPNLEEVITSALLHDIREDYGIEDSYIRVEFGNEVADAVEKLTKKFRGYEKDKKTYFEELSKCAIASIVKGADRIHNVNSMVWVFSPEKQLSYVSEVREYFLPMLKKARKNFPEQTFAYLNVETVLLSLTRLVEFANTKTV